MNTCSKKFWVQKTCVKPTQAIRGHLVKRQATQMSVPRTTFEIPQPRRVITLKDLIARLAVIAATSPETLNNPVQINFDMGSFRDVEAVWVHNNSVILSEDE